MSLETERELANTRRKLSVLEADYQSLASQGDDEDEELRELTMESLKRLINQLKEEIARFEAHHAVRR